MTGIILLDKQKDITSFSACNRVKHILGVKKAGHTGTLDPMATGVLTVALGGATRFIELLPVHDKAYTARVQLGITTDTLDITGNVLSENDVSVTKEALLSAASQFRGEIMQKPPMYSAVFKDGKRLYELARQGIEVERDARPVHISKLELLEFDESDQKGRLVIACSKGTYIRVICDDIGSALGCGCVMTSLRRTRACGFTLDDAVTLEQLRMLADENRIPEILRQTDVVFEGFSSVNISEKQAVRFINGAGLSLSRLRSLRDPAEGELIRVYSCGTFMGLGEVHLSEDELAVKKRFAD